MSQILEEAAPWPIGISASILAAVVAENAAYEADDDGWANGDVLKHDARERHASGHSFLIALRD